MPVNAALMKRAGKGVERDSAAYFTDVSLSEFRQWAKSHGKVTYIKWLLYHPAYSIIEPLRDLPAILSTHILASSVGRLEPQGYESLLYSLYSFNTMEFIIEGLLVAVLIIVCIRSDDEKVRKTAIFSLAMLLLAIPHLFVVWNGDASDMFRHATHVALQIKIAVLVLVAVSLDPVARVVSRFTAGHSLNKMVRRERKWIGTLRRHQTM